MSDSLTLTVQLPQPVLQEAVNAAVEDQVRAHLAAMIQRQIEAPLREAVAHAIARTLVRPDDYVAAGAGWTIVAERVRAHLAAVDLSEIIQRSTAAHLGRAVDEAVIRLLPEKARAQAGEMARNGTLPPPGSGVGA